MFIYAGIDEAGYGPLLGPLLIGRSIFAFHAEDSQSYQWDNLPNVWNLLEKAVTRKLVGRKHRITIGDSKKLITKAAGVKHLETGLLSFAKLTPSWKKYAAPNDPTEAAISLSSLFDLFGEQSHHDLSGMPWYEVNESHPWQLLPTASEAGEIAIASGMLKREMAQVGIEILDLGAAVVFENRFNQMATATRNKASTSFTFVAQHLHHIWQNHGTHNPCVCVDRQGGRTRYLRVLQTNFPDASIRILDESTDRSAYQLTQDNRQMCITFETKGEDKHFPIALASMVCKYSRELLMHRINTFFQSHAPELKPTKGYTQDGRRFLEDLAPLLPSLQIAAEDMMRIL
ncbi:hypothetical protein JD969_07675 [Planctomycetota bacterium]|nr:hypothetical protein JD969_07675 [Planctomycetota bacterium]